MPLAKCKGQPCPSQTLLAVHTEQHDKLNNNSSEWCNEGVHTHTLTGKPRDGWTNGSCWGNDWKRITSRGGQGPTQVYWFKINEYLIIIFLYSRRNILINCAPIHSCTINHTELCLAADRPQPVAGDKGKHAGSHPPDVSHKLRCTLCLHSARDIYIILLLCLWWCTVPLSLVLLPQSQPMCFLNKTLKVLYHTVQHIRASKVHYIDTHCHWQLYQLKFINAV